MLDMLYRVNKDDMDVARGLQWIGPAERFEPGTWTTVARAEKTCEDGQSVDIQIMAMPARFFRLAICGGQNSCNEQQSEYEITTGSSGGELNDIIAPMARLIAGGMLAFRLGVRRA